MDINELVTGFQNGQLENFDAIYTSMTVKRRGLLFFIRSRLPRSIGEHEVQAIYDDSLVKAVETFKAEGEATFSTYLTKIVRNRVNDAVRKANTARQITHKEPLYLDSMESHEKDLLFYSLGEETAETVFNSLKESQTYQLLLSYIAECPSNSDDVVYILLDSMEYINPAEKYETVRTVMKTGITDGYIRQKISRAKRNFKSFLKKS